MTHTVITSGLCAEDQVVIGPYKILDKLKHDQAIKDERESKKAKDDPNEPNEPNQVDANQL